MISSDRFLNAGKTRNNSEPISDKMITGQMRLRLKEKEYMLMRLVKNEGNSISHILDIKGFELML